MIGKPRGATQFRKIARIAGLLVGLALLSAVLVTVTASAGGAHHLNAATTVGLAVAFLASRLLTLRLPRGDEVSVAVVVGIFGLATASIWEVLLAALAAGLIDAGVSTAQSARRGQPARVLDVLRSAAVICAASPWQLALRNVGGAAGGGDLVVAWAVFAGATYVGLDILTLALQEWAQSGLPVSRGLSTLWRPLGAVYLVHLSMAAVAVRLSHLSGGWAFPVALLLTLILQNSFNLYLRIRRAYTETISALARAAELDRPSDSGRSRRVCDLSIAVGRRMGLSSHELEGLGYAALLHEIGKIGDPTADLDSRYLERGAVILAGIPFLSDVAQLIDTSSCSTGKGPVPGAVIVRACAEYDARRSEVGARSALASLKAGEIRPADTQSKVVDILTDIVDEQYAGTSTLR